jgi:hypothetical protein
MDTVYIMDFVLIQPSHARDENFWEIVRAARGISKIENRRHGLLRLLTTTGEYFNNNSE